MPDGLYHEKIGFFSDAEGNSIYFSGSSNATVSGIRKNWENITVLASWWGDDELIAEQQEYYEDLWRRRRTCFTSIRSVQILILQHKKCLMVIDEDAKRRSFTIIRKLQSVSSLIMMAVIFLKWQREQVKRSRRLKPSLNLQKKMRICLLSY